MAEKCRETSEGNMIEFDHDLSLALDEATEKAERGLPMWNIIKKIIERIIFAAPTYGD